MKLLDRIIARQNDMWNQPGVTIAFLGDSVTQGCFDIFVKEDQSLDAVYDQNFAYHRYFSKIMGTLYPNVPFNILNAGLAGDCAPHGYERLERDVLRHHPDFVVVCFGLNDCGGGLEGIPAYEQALKHIFAALKEQEIETLFLTPNMMCTSVSGAIQNEELRRIAESAKQFQNSGVMDAYMDAARRVCREAGVPVCDCYEKWKNMERSGVRITNLLANHVNHPTRELNWLFAVSLVETILNPSVWEQPDPADSNTAPTQSGSYDGK